jgi:pantothenate kinase
MTNELGRELTAAEAIAVATGQTTIMDVLHGVALELDAERGAEVIQVCTDGFKITRAMVEQEIRRTKSSWRDAPISSGRGSWVIGVNASSNMFT